MLRKTLLYILAPILVVIVVVVITVNLISVPAKFIIKNLDAAPVTVVVHWRDKTKDVGRLPSNAIKELFIENEAAMTLDVTRSNGTAVHEENIYFTSDMVIRINITHTGVEILSDLR